MRAALFRTRNMARRCELTGKQVEVGQIVSHANNKTKRVFRPNLQVITLASESLGTRHRLKIAMSTLRTLDSRGGLDAFLLKAKNDGLSPRALKLKRQIQRAEEKRAAKAA